MEGGGRGDGDRIEEKRGCNGIWKENGRGWMTGIEEENGINRGV